MTGEPPEHVSPGKPVRFTARDLRAARNGIPGALPQPIPGVSFRRRSRSPLTLVAGTLVLVLVVGLIAYVAPLAWASWRAYQRIFVTPVPR
ncbi:MAG: LytR family transcriptional regulator, partial [Thermomicrobium sp.]|nr:LytR family transcriptional regulator [Thermomicrobium sp.]